MDSPTVPSMLPPGISHPAKRSCTQTSSDQSGAGRRGNMPPQQLKLPHPPSCRPPPDSGRRGHTPGRQDHMITPRGGWQSPRTPRGGWQGVPHVRSAGRVMGFGHREFKHSAPFVPSEGDMKIQLSSTTMAWVDRSGNILHQWKRTKRGTRGGKNRRQEEQLSGATPRAAREPTPRDGSKPPRGRLPPPVPQAPEQLNKHNGTKQVDETPTPVGGHHSDLRQDSDCSSTCDLNDGSQIDATRSDSVQAAVGHDRQDSHVSSEQVGDAEDFGPDHMLITDPSSTSPHEMAELVTRLYGLVTVLQNDNEQLRKTCAEIQLNSSSSDGEVAQLKQKLQQVTSERDLLQQQVLFQH